ncbi:hypothetical protein [Lysinibacillus boronitolerans]|uniref:hypothetical protein n=1 Tax=Lysinibacillus boronitolerans TaxID=309788 RepID=UPI00289BB858|nr:hypothetical protein [Bacillus mobilis]
MTFEEVINKLNTDTNVVELAKELGKQRSTIEKKLANRAIVYNKEHDCWEYMGGNPTISLKTKILERTAVLDCDKEFVESQNMNKPKPSAPKEENNNKDKDDKEYRLFSDYRNIDKSTLNTKKTIAVNERQYKALKDYCKSNGLIFNQLIATLINAGLEHYEIILEKQ